ncbi:MAG TPA: hypothetical protein ENH01_03985 [Nitrospirae bacterium]|nr:hypothetical protein [Nitrospirota bacterium]
MRYYDGVKEIDCLLASKVSKKNSEKLLALIRTDVAFENYFFSKVKKISWFIFLKNADYFNPERVPHNIPEWNVCSYIENVSEQINLPRNKKYINELLQIIKDVSNHKDADGHHIDNYGTWLNFVKILLNIPREKISFDVIELIPIWLDSRLDASLVGSELGLKLLPKFLHDDPSPEDITKAERIVDFITQVKSIKLDEERAKLYDKEEEYKLIVDLYWVKEIFEKYSKDIGEKCTNNIIDALSDRIQVLLKRDESLIPFETNSNAYLLALSSDNGTCSVEVFDVGGKAEFNVYEQIYRKKKREEPSIKALSIDETSLDDFTVKVFEFLTTDEPFKSSDESQMKRDIHNLYCNFYNRETYASLHDESRTHHTSPLEVLSFALKSILLFKAKKHIDETKEILAGFFDEKYLYFPKMALYIVGKNINIYSDVFWEALEKDTSNLIFGGIYFGDELKHVLENLSDLSSHQKELIIKKLNDVPGYVPDEDAERYITEWKQERCQALMKFPEFKKLYESLKSQTGKDVGLHAAVGEIHVRDGWGHSSLTKEEILQMLSTNKLPSYLKNFKSKGFWEDGPTVGGLAKLIKECAAENTDKFIDKLPPFNDTGFIYVYEILDGIKEAWNNKQDIAWGKFIEFIYQYIDRDEFWKDHFIVEKDDFLGGANHFWIIGVVTDLIREVSRDDARPFDETCLKKSEQILFLVFDNLEAEEEEEISDYVTHALNSSHGKTLSAFINLTLRIARTNDKKGDKAEIKWSAEIKDKYDELLEKKIIESYTFLGRYLPNLFYLDKAWAEEKVKDLYPDSVDRYWEAFMDGYLSIGTVYNDLYELVNPHYEFARSYTFKEKHDNEHLVQHIALGYLLGFDKRGLDNTESLIRKVLDGWKPRQISDIVRFLWSQQRYLREEPEGDKKIVEKIISIWSWIYENKYKDKSKADITEDDRGILSDLGRLTVFLPHIDEEYSRWLLLSVPYLKMRGSSFVIESLNKFDDAGSVGYVGKIFLKMLEYFIPDFYKKHHIRSIVEKLYQYDQNDYANAICETYGKKNQDDFLRDLWEKNN